MAKAVAKFEKVSFEQFNKDFRASLKWSEIGKVWMFPQGMSGWDDKTPNELIKGVYDDIILPKRATIGSAGYDFYCPVQIKLNPGESIKIPTGIKCRMNKEWVLKLYPRSGLGFKYRLQLNNTVGIIDSDYYGSQENEGHIMAKITNDTNEEKTVSLLGGEGFMQGIFVEYGITEDDDASSIRVGGLGSTTK